MPGLVLTFALGLLILGHCPPQTLANTQIINFPAGNPVPVAPLPQNWTVLHAGTDEIFVWDITPAPSHAPCKDDGAPGECPHDLWFALDLDHGGAWTPYDRFTLRVSWPASHPVAVALSLTPRPSAAPFRDPSPHRTAPPRTPPPDRGGRARPRAVDGAALARAARRASRAARARRPPGVRAARRSDAAGRARRRRVWRAAPRVAGRRGRRGDGEEGI
ncbi:hypothetical protein EDB89DRAFT_414826 [Lactarius sanguifluus]|nr:hypothetical protein EDB89DRAFT_414826 [Lactarius sanguifluus]